MGQATAKYRLIASASAFLRILTTVFHLKNRVIQILTIGKGFFRIRFKRCLHYVKEDDFVQNKGNINMHPKKLDSISYSSNIPKEAEYQNLFVPVCFPAHKLLTDRNV